jgi:hypothetical protein
VLIRRISVLDVTEDEAAILLASYDPLSAMAERDDAKLSELLDSLTSVTSSGLQDLLASLAAPTSDAGADLTPVDRDPPSLAWVLVGVPLARCGEIAAAVEQIASIDGVIVETTAADDPNG